MSGKSSQKKWAWTKLGAVYSEAGDIRAAQLCFKHAAVTGTRFPHFAWLTKSCTGLFRRRKVLQKRRVCGFFGSVVPLLVVYCVHVLSLDCEGLAGPFPIGKSEIDADPVAAYGGIWNVTRASATDRYVS
jgi:hypothetical protein